MLADRPVTGGYPVVAVVIRADIGRVARLRPGDELWFAAVTLDAAREAWQHAMATLDAIDPLPPADDDEGAWAGAHA
jgi:allophanate hydrolase subunit 2